MKRQRTAISLKIKQPQKFLFLLASTVSFLLVSNSDVSAGFQWSSAPTRAVPQVEYHPAPAPVLEIPAPIIAEPVPVIEPKPVVKISPQIITPAPIVTPIITEPVPEIIIQRAATKITPTYSRTNTQHGVIDAPFDLTYTPNTPDIPALAPITIIEPEMPKMMEMQVQEKAPTEAYFPDMPTSEFSTIEGFGSDLPMALALRQIVPPEYSFAFGDGVNPGYRVSWSGGKPWNEIVQDMITPLQLHLRVYGTIVSIKTEQTQYNAAVPMRTMKAIRIQEEEKPIPLMHFSSKSRNQDEWKWDHGVIIKPNPLLEQRSGAPDTPKSTIKRMNITDPGEHTSHQPQPLIEEPAAIQNIGQITQQDQDLVIPDEPIQLLTKQFVASKIVTPDNMMPVTAPSTWNAKQGDSLRGILEKWGHIANAELVWGGTQDHAINSDIKIDGTYENALQVLFSYTLDNETRPSYSLLSKKDGNQVVYTLIIQE